MKQAPPDKHRCVLVPRHSGDHIFPNHKPIGDRYRDGEFLGRVLHIPGVTVRADRGRCTARRSTDEPGLRYDLPSFR
jgi:hypothetical protein